MITSQEYFDKHSENYDLQCEKYYWSLCNDISWDVLSNFIENNKANITNIIDLGGGTGFFVKKILEKFPEINVTLLDNSSGMINCAKNNLTNYKNVTFVKQDLLNDVHFDFYAKFDMCLNMYVSIFVDDISKLFSNLAQYVKNGGYVFYIGQNIHHTISMLISNGMVDKLDNLILNKSIKLLESLPKLNLQSKEEIEMLCKLNCMDSKLITSFPKYARTGLREKMTGNNFSISDILKYKKNYSKILQLELNNIHRTGLDNGMYWLMIAKKLNIVENQK